MGTLLFARMRRHTSRPSMPGIITSSSTMSNGSASSAESPRCPSGAPVTANPFCSRYVVKSSWSRLSSSMSRTRGIVLLGSRGFGFGGGSFGLRRSPVGPSIPPFVIAPAVVAVAVGTVAVMVVVAHRVDGKTVPKNRSQSEQSDLDPTSHDVPPSAGDPAVFDHVAQHLALAVVEDAMDFAERLGGR